MTDPRQLPDRIAGFRSGVINGILDYLESLRPVDTRSVWHSWTPSGVQSHATSAGDRPAASMPFDVDSYNRDTNVVTLIAGDIEIHGETEAGTTTTYKTVSPLTVTLTGSGTEYVWAEMTWSGSAWGTPVFAKGASKPNDTGTTYRRLLWTLVDGAPSVQYHRGNIEFVGWRMT
jgi:hypothetical protein